MLFILVILNICEGKILANTSKGSAIQPFSSNSGTVTDYVFYLITEISVNSGNYLKIEFPAEYSNIHLGSSICYIGSSSASCSQIGSLTVSITLNSFISPNSRYTIRVPKITNPSSITTSYFIVYFQYSASSQIIDINDAFGTISIAGSINSITGSITALSSIAGASSAYTFNFTLGTALPSGSQFQIILPSYFSFTNNSCSSVAYNNVTSAITGPFTCSQNFGMLVISGLSQNLKSGYGVVFQIYITNPAFYLAAASGNFVIRTIYGYGTVVLDQAVISNKIISTGKITSINHVVFSPFSQFVSGNLIYTNLTFITSNQIGDGGSIVINYGTTVTSDQCVLILGVYKNSAGSDPSCTVSTNTITITNFGTILPYTTIQIINQLTIASVSGLTITTINANSVNIDASTSGGGITLTSSYNLLSSYSASLAITTGRTGTISLTVTSTSSDTITSIKICLPSSITPGSSVICTINSVSAPCTYASNALTITPSSTSCDSGCSIILDTTGKKWIFPSIESSFSNILEISTALNFTSSTSEFETTSVSLDPSGFSSSSLNCVAALSVWSPFVINLTLSNTLNSTISSPYILIQFTDFDTNDLGTGLSAGNSIGCTLTGISSYSKLSPVSCIFTPNAVSQIKITSFASISAGSAISIMFMAFTPLSASSTSITVTLGYTQYNTINTVTDTTTFSINFNSAATDWTANVGSSQTVTTINSITYITFEITPAVSSSVGDLLIVIFPPGWNLVNLTSQVQEGNASATALSNSYAPSVLINLGSNILTGASANNLTISLKTGAYQGSGLGNIQIGHISVSPWTLAYYGTVTDGTSSKTYAGATKSSFYYANYLLSNQDMSAGDVLYKFYLTPKNPIPSKGKIVIVFPAGFNIQYSYCNFYSQLGTSTTCTISLLTITISGFVAIAANSTIYINVLNVINPSASSTNTLTIYSLYSSVATQYIDYSTLNATALQASPGAANVTIKNYTFFPLSTGCYGEFSLTFFMDASVPQTGKLTIAFPSGFSLPTITSSNCIFNLEFSSCSNSGNTLTILPVSTFSAGVLMSLFIPEITVPSNLTQGISITSTYASLTVASNNVTDPSALFTASPSPSTIFNPTLSIIPSNLGEIATYTFAIIANISSTDTIIIWFPSSFPSELGNVNCKSSGSVRGDGHIDCYQAYTSSIQASGIVSSNFTFIIYGLNNPGSIGDTGSINIQIISSSNNVKSYGTISTAITNAPSTLQIINITLSDYNVCAVANYTFITTAPSIPTSIWFDFPIEFNSELFGLGDTFQCNSILVDSSSGSPTSWTSGNVHCVNSLANRIVLQATGSGSIGSNLLKTTIIGVKSTSILGQSHSFRVSLLNGNAIIAKSYDSNLNTFVSYISNKEILTVSNPNGIISMNIGVTQLFSIYTASVYNVAKENIGFTYRISSLNSVSGITINPSPLILSAGSTSLNFFITCGSNLTVGNYILEWSTNSSIYMQPKYTLLRIDPQLLYRVTVSYIPNLSLGTTSIPITVNAQAAPTSDLTINAVGPGGLTITPILIPAGSFYTTYKISVPVLFLSGTYQITFSLQGDNSEVFYLDSSEPYIIVTSYDTTVPSIASFVISSPRHKTYINMTIQASESCMFFYTYGARGMLVPSNMTLINNSLAGVSGYYEGIIDATYQYSFSISGLTAESDYVLYGLLGDVSGNFMASVFTIDLFTADLDDSIYFTVGFLQPYPSLTQMSNDVITAFEYQFVVPASRISFISSTASTATYQLLSSLTTDDPSPDNIIAYTADVTSINSLLNGITLDPSFDIDNSIVDVINPKPIWIIIPYINNATTESSVSVIFSMAYPGTVYAEVIGDSEVIPSSKQIASKLNAFNLPANFSYSMNATANTITNMTFGGLQPTSSYTLVITAENNNIPVRYMDNDFMAIISFITQAGIVNTNTSTNTTSFAHYFSITCISVICYVW